MINLPKEAKISAEWSDMIESIDLSCTGWLILKSFGHVAKAEREGREREREER